MSRRIVWTINDNAALEHVEAQLQKNFPGITLEKLNEHTYHASLNDELTHSKLFMMLIYSRGVTINFSH